MIFPVLENKIKMLIAQSDQIEKERMPVLQELVHSLESSGTNLNFVCTHNARRSQLGQVWAQTAAYYFGLKNFRAFSGGTEASSIHPNTLLALKIIGFEVTQVSPAPNPHYHVKFSHEADALHLFSKTIDDPANPQSNFVAVMTCSHADENCPVVNGAAKRISLTYEDPGKFDDSAKAVEMYIGTSDRIAREMFYAFSKKSESILKR